MNIQEFINVRDKCPICDNTLITQFISNRKQKIRFQDGRIIIIFVMKSLAHNQQDYEVGYSFDLQDNTFNIEFYTEWDTYNFIPLHLIEKFKKFYKNLGPCKFSRRCTFCNKYELTSTLFDLNFKSQQIDFIILNELYGLTLPAENGCKIIYLFNSLKTNTSDIIWFRADSESVCRLDFPMPNSRSRLNGLPIIPFVSKEETTKRLNNLITFA